MTRGVPVLVAAAVLLTGGCSNDAPDGSDASPSPSPSVAQSPAVAPGPNIAAFRGRLVRIATLTEPLGFATRANDDAFYIAQKTGQVVAIRGGTVDNRPVLDLSREVSHGGEQGLLGLAFSPDGGSLYVNYTDADGDTHVREYAMVGAQADPASARDVLLVDQPFSNHNGGQLVFGPDGFLYIGLGDGGSAGDPRDNAQNLGSLLGKILRINPSQAGDQPYSIPAGNPFIGQEGARPEIWDYGLRNPWRFSFDRDSGDLWIGDVGQDRLEEIDRETTSTGGLNYGWDGYEGNLVYEQPVPEDAIVPVHSYGGELGSSVIGGFVYRGAEIPALQGAYLFGDFYNPQIRALVRGPSGSGFEEVPLGLTVANLSAFGQDAAGELYVLSLSGPVYRLTP